MFSMAKIDDERGERVDNPASPRTMTRKIAAIMAADVVGYSRLVANDEEDTLHRLLDYRQVFFDFVGRAGGRVFNTAGDSVLAEFPSAVEALRARRSRSRKAFAPATSVFQTLVICGFASA